MTLEEAAESWMRRHFDSVPIELVKKAYQDCWEELELLSSSEPTLDYPCAWGWMFSPENSCDREWILRNVDKVEDCGFLVFQSEECGVLLGIDGVGYSFFEEHWIPLYKKRGLSWHQSETE